MKPILFPAGQTSFQTNGLGRLIDAISCTVTEERNGSYELHMEYPIDGALMDQITYSRIIYQQQVQEDPAYEEDGPDDRRSGEAAGSAGTAGKDVGVASVDTRCADGRCGQDLLVR